MHSTQEKKAEKSLSKRIVSVEIEPKRKGITPSGKVRFLDMTVKIVFNNGTSLFQEVEDEKELHALLNKHTKPIQTQGHLL